MAHPETSGLQPHLRRCVSGSSWSAHQRPGLQPLLDVGSVRHDSSSSSRLASWAVYGLGLTLAHPHITEKERQSQSLVIHSSLGFKGLSSKRHQGLGRGCAREEPGLGGGSVCDGGLPALPGLSLLRSAASSSSHLYKREISVSIKRKQPARPSLTVLAMKGAVYHFSSHIRAPA